jgi:hypothetical protein
MNDPLAGWLAELRIQHTFLVVGRIFDQAPAVRIEPEGAAAFHY